MKSLPHGIATHSDDSEIATTTRQQEGGAESPRHPLFSGQLTYLASEAALAAFFAALASFFSFLSACFLSLAGLDVAAAGAVAVAESVVFGATAAGACAKETAATLESKVAAMRDLILNMIGTHKTRSH